MAETTDLIEFLDKRPESAEQFKPYAYYGEEEDALTFFFRDEQDYAKRLNKRVTVYLSTETGDLTGCLIKNVRQVLEDIGWFDVQIDHGRVNLKMLFLALRGTFAEQTEGRTLYRELGKRVSAAGEEISIKVPPSGQDTANCS